MDLQVGTHFYTFAYIFPGGIYTHGSSLACPIEFRLFFLYIYIYRYRKNSAKLAFF